MSSASQVILILTKLKCPIFEGFLNRTELFSLLSAVLFTAKTDILDQARSGEAKMCCIVHLWQQRLGIKIHNAMFCLTIYIYKKNQISYKRTPLRLN